MPVLRIIRLKQGWLAVYFRETMWKLYFYLSPPMHSHQLSSRLLQKVKVPIVILNLQPLPQLDYEAFSKLGDRVKKTGVWLEHCQACSVPEIASVFNRSGIGLRYWSRGTWKILKHGGRLKPGQKQPEWPEL